MNVRATDMELPRFASVEKLIETLKPGEPVYMLYPEKFRIAAQRFLDAFPGDTLFAIKANPAPHVLDLVYASGIRHFDTASLPEIEMVHAAAFRMRNVIVAAGAGSLSRHRKNRLREAQRPRFRDRLRLRARQTSCRNEGRKGPAHLRADCHTASGRGPCSNCRASSAPRRTTPRAF